VTPSLPHLWHETPNVRFLTIRDFEDFCKNKGLQVIKAVYLDAGGTLRCCPNLFARDAIFVLVK
jgi:hypothetical protein